MSLRSQLVTLVLATLGAFLTFYLLQRQLVGVLPGSGVAGEVVAALERSQADLKTLARSDPARRDEYHARFEAHQALANRLRIVDHNREEIARRQQALLLGAAAIALLAFGGALLVGARRDARRLLRVREALGDLAAGRRDIRLSDPHRDHIGQVARMIESASDAVARDRQRLATPPAPRLVAGGRPAAGPRAADAAHRGSARRGPRRGAARRGRRPGRCRPVPG